MKPTRAEFKAALAVEWPGATMLEADRGLYVVVGTARAARAIEMKARAVGYTDIGIDQDGPESFTVSMFGFPRGRRETTYRPADDHDDSLMDLLDRIERLAQAKRQSGIAELASRGLALLKGKAK